MANYSLEHIAKQRPTLPISHSLFEIMSAAWHNVSMDRETPEGALRRAKKEMQTLIDQWKGGK